MPNKPANSILKDQSLQFRLEKLRQIVIASELCVLLILAQHIWLGRWRTTEILIVLALALWASYLIAKRGRLMVGAAILLSTLTLVASYFMWMYGGVRDEAILILPAILIFTAVIASYGLFLLLLGFMLVNLLVLGYVNEVGVYVNNDMETGLYSAVLLALILSIISFSVWLLSSDLRKMLEKLSIENQRVRESQQEIHRLVNHDPLTDLPNRRLAKFLFEQALAASNRRELMVAIIFLDLDHFKAINDSLGHQAGDLYLQKLTQRLRGLLRESDTLCRFGGDEFVLIIQNVEHHEQLAMLCQKILSHATQSVMIQNNEICLTASIGIAVSPADGGEFDGLCQKADMAMYSAKERGRNNYCFFSEDMNQSAQEVLQLQLELRQAIAAGQLALHYQPKVELKSGRITGAEALLRWEHASRGFIAPDIFIPLAERSGLIIELGDWVLKEAVRQCRRWHLMGFDWLTMAINVSSIQFKRGHFELAVMEALDNASLEGRFLELELTESLLLDVQPALQQSLASIQDKGVGLSIDDFGTGYSNLGYLKRFRVSVLKIDKSFVTNLAGNSQNEAIVQAIIQMAQSLKIGTVAEGVEDGQTAAKLIDMGCEVGQGYHWSKPLPSADFLRLIKPTA